jgi:hypothetical protein
VLFLSAGDPADLTFDLQPESAMQRIAHAGLLLLFLFASTTAFSATRPRRLVVAATCVGATPCRACKNCRYCKRCAKDGGTCGVCRRQRSQDEWQQAAARNTAQHEAH